MTSAAVFDYAGGVVSVETSDLADLAWLQEFLRPDFEKAAGAAGAPACDIALSRDDDAYAALYGMGAAPVAPAAATAPTVPCFALDGRVEALPLWNSPDERTVVHSEAFATFITRQKPGGPFRLVARTAGAGPRVALLRVVREVVSADLVARARLVVHAAAFTWQGRACVLAGPKQAGKTTLLLHLLSEAGAQLLANDRVAMWRDGHAAVARGVPTIVSLRSSSLDRLPRLADRFAASHDHHRFSIAEAEAQRGRPAGDSRDRSMSLTPAQLARLLGIERSPQVPLGAVLFPRRSGERGGLSIIQLASDEAGRRLHHTRASLSWPCVRDCGLRLA